MFGLIKSVFDIFNFVHRLLKVFLKHMLKEVIIPDRLSICVFICDKLTTKIYGVDFLNWLYKE